MAKSKGHSSSERRQGRGKRGDGATSRSRFSTAGIASRTRGAAARENARQPTVAHITGNSEEDRAILRGAAETALNGGPPGFVDTPTANVVPPPSLLAGLRTSGFRPGTPFFTSVECGADFIERALTEPDNQALHSLSKGTLIGHLWRDS
ncbi:hypothetical protein U1Q18_030235, partial [Sarracenia purpurea var. burkii]